MAEPAITLNDVKAGAELPLPHGRWQRPQVTSLGHVTGHAWSSGGLWTLNTQPFIH